MTMTEAQAKAVEAILAKGDRVELIPVKDGVKVIQIQRKEIKENRPHNGGGPRPIKQATGDLY